MPKKKKSKIPTITEEEYERYVLNLKNAEEWERIDKNKSINTSEK